jgi:two-component sensor histidine kinase
MTVLPAAALAGPADSETPDQPQRRWTISQRLALVYGCVSLVILLGAGTYAWWQASNLSRRNEALAVAETQRLADRIGGLLAQASQGVAVLSATAPLDRDPESCQDALNAAHLTMAAFVRHLFFVGPERQIICGTLPDAMENSAGDSALIRATEMTGRPLTGTLDRRALALGPVIGVGHPLRRLGRYMGTAIAIVTVEDMREITARSLPAIHGLRVWLRDSADATTSLVGPESEMPPLPGALHASLMAPRPTDAGMAMSKGHLLVEARATDDLTVVAEVPRSFVRAGAPLEVAIPPLLLASVLLAGLGALFWSIQRFVFAPLEVAMRRLESPDGSSQPEENESGAAADILELIRRLGATRSTRDEAIRLRDLLLREAHHRIKNHLALVTSFLRLQERQLSDHAALQALRAAQGRMVAIGLTYELLHDGAGQFVALDQMLARFSRALAARDMAEGRATQVETDLEPIEVPADIAVKIALVVNELATNSLKYAFVGRAPGTVRITLRRAGRDGFTMRVADDGAGMPEGARRGLGMTVVDSLLRGMDARIERLPGPGTVFLITWNPRIPMTSAATPPTAP